MVQTRFDESGAIRFDIQIDRLAVAFDRTLIHLIRNLFDGVSLNSRITPRVPNCCENARFARFVSVALSWVFTHRFVARHSSEVGARSSTCTASSVTRIELTQSGRLARIGRGFRIFGASIGYIPRSGQAASTRLRSPNKPNDPWARYGVKTMGVIVLGYEVDSNGGAIK